MSNFDVTAVMVDYKGKQIERGGIVCPECNRPIDLEKMTLRDVLIEALVNEMGGEKIDGREKLRRHKLAMRISSHDSVSLSAEEVVLLKEQTPKFYKAMIAGRVWEILDPETERGDPKE